MTSELVIDTQKDEISIALLEDGKLMEFQKEQQQQSYSAGNMYVAKVKKLMPGLNACFVDVGHERDAFLHFLDLGPNYYSFQKFLKQLTGNRKRSLNITKANRQPILGKDGAIQDVLKVGDEVLVQIAKEPISTKGPRLNCEINLAGRLLILLPFENKVSVSGKIKSSTERNRLKQIISSILPQNYGVIVRTVAEGKKAAELDQELRVLLKRWEATVTAVQKSTHLPALVYEETSRSVGLLRDLFNPSYEAIHVNDPSTYDFPDYNDAAFAEVLNGYRDWTRLFGFLDNPYEDYLSTQLSRFSERTEDNQNIDLQLRVVREKYNMNVGVSLQPQHSHFVQQYLGVPVDTIRTVTNISPTLNMRYRFNQQTNLQVTFRGSTSQPSITQLLDIYDDTNPLSINMGNPGLKPSFTTNLSTNFQMQRRPTYVEDSLGYTVPKAQRHWSFSTNASFQRTSNSIGTVVTYNETTGGRISRPENINGNWNTRAGASFNIGLDTLNRWDVSGSVSGSYDHRVGYVNLNRTAIPDRNVTHTINVSPSASLSFRNKWLYLSLNANTTYAHTENRLQASRNLTTWNFSYGGNTRITFPLGSNISTDIHPQHQRTHLECSGLT